MGLPVLPTAPNTKSDDNGEGAALKGAVLLEEPKGFVEGDDGLEGTNRLEADGLLVAGAAMLLLLASLLVCGAVGSSAVPCLTFIA